MTHQDILARLLRADKDTIGLIVERLEKFTGERDIIEQFVEGNASLIEDRLRELGVTERNSDVIFHALWEKIRRDEQAISEYLGKPRCDSEEGCGMLIKTVKEIAHVGKGYFLKRDKAAEFLLNEPPKNTIAFFQFKGVDELLHHYELFEVYSALRFMEDKEWLNNVFFKQLDLVTPYDFEEREIEVHVLHPEWLRAAESFVKKKYHNVSHLKELGIIFVIPQPTDAPGALMRLLTLMLHYLHEIRFYSDLFNQYARWTEVDFARHIVSALRGDVSDEHISTEERGLKWLIIQRYLAKEDENDWRLFEAHINPEAFHWSKAEDDVVALGDRIPGSDLKFWKGLDYAGGYFPDASGVEVMVSFNLVDTIMSLVGGRSRYRYHHQEALWNKFFASYVGEERMERLVKKAFNSGYINLNTLTLEEKESDFASLQRP